MHGGAQREFTKARVEQSASTKVSVVHPGVPDCGASCNTDERIARMAKKKTEKAAEKALEKAKDAVAEARRTAKKVDAKAKKRAKKVESELKDLAAKIEKDAAKRAKRAKRLASSSTAAPKPSTVLNTPAATKKSATTKTTAAPKPPAAPTSVPSDDDVVIVAVHAEPASVVPVSTPTPHRATALVDEAVERGDLSALTVVQLRARAREEGVTGYGKFTKAQLIASLAD